MSEQDEQEARRLASEDWIKTRTWDVYTTTGRLATTVDDLREIWLGAPDAWLKTLLVLPSAQAMPPALRAEIKAL